MDERAVVAPSSTADERAEVVLLLDLALGVVTPALSVLAEVGRPFSRLSRPVAHLLLRPPLVPTWLQPELWLDRAARRGAAYRGEVLTEVDQVLDRLVPALVSGVLRHLDLTRLLQRHVDVVTLAEEVIAEIDLPALIRDSTGAVASDTVLGVRMQSISGDEAVARAVARLRARLVRGTAPTPSPLVVP